MLPQQNTLKKVLVNSKWMFHDNKWPERERNEPLCRNRNKLYSKIKIDVPTQL